MNRALSLKSRKGTDSSDSGHKKHRFTVSSLRQTLPGQPELSKKLSKLIKSENHSISAFESAGREGVSIASQLSEWGESTGDDGISEVSDKLGVLLAEIAEQEDNYAQNLEEYRGVLKQIRNTETSVQPSRDHKAKIADELAKLKYKEPASTKIVTLEQELVRAEAQSLVAEAQLTNVTRQKFREAYAVHLAAVLERSEKQAILAKEAQKLLYLLDDTPIVPGEERPAFTGSEEARGILNEAERQLKEWSPSSEHSMRDQAPLTSSGLPIEGSHQSHAITSAEQVTSPTSTHTANNDLYEAPPSSVGATTSAGSHHNISEGEHLKNQEIAM